MWDPYPQGCIFYRPEYTYIYRPFNWRTAIFPKPEGIKCCNLTETCIWLKRVLCQNFRAPSTLVCILQNRNGLCRNVSMSQNKLILCDIILELSFLLLFFSVADMLSASGKTSGKMSSNFKLVDRLKSTGPNPSLVRGSSHLRYVSAAYASKSCMEE